jgi:hypothetical protein
MTQSPVEAPAQRQEQEPGVLTGDFQSRWYWISDTRSAENGEISVLAIIKTIIAGTLAYLFYRWTNALWHVGVAACLSPFLLLRTSRSTELTLHTAETAYSSDITNIPYIKIMLSPLIVGLIRFGSILVCLIKHPIETIGAISQNWQRVVLCADICSIPELISTIEQTLPTGSPLGLLRVRGLFRVVIILLPDL